MPDMVNEIAAELKTLRRGRGVFAPDVADRIGPRLAQLCRTAGATDGRSIRRALIEGLRRCAERLPAESRRAVEVSLGFHPDVQDRVTTQRVAWLATELSRDARTAHRRIDGAERLLAEMIAEELDRSTSARSNGWHLERFHVALRLDSADSRQATEIRRIVASDDGVDEVVACYDVPRVSPHPPPVPEVEVLWGGDIVRVDRPRPGNFRFVIRLPRTLMSGDSHEYGLMVRVPAGQMVRTHYIFTPERWCAGFALRVRFPTNDLPRWIRAVNGETVRDFDAVETPTELLQPDPVGEVAVSFTEPRLYLGYGIQWWGLAE